MQRNTADGAMPQFGTGYAFGVWRAIDLGLRIVYLTIAPALLALFAALMPVTGVLVGAGIATVVTLIGGERWHRAVDRIPIAGRVLGGMARLDEFYREHPPKPLAFYIVYPLLLPVILARKVTRRELVLYRKVNTIALIVIVGGGAWDYYRHWQPEIGFAPFFGLMVVGFVIQFCAMFALSMPIVTTIAMLRLRNATKTLIAVLALVASSAAFGAYSAHEMKFATSFSVFERARYRTLAGIAELRACTDVSHDVQACAVNNRTLLALERAIDVADATLKGDPTAHDIAEARAQAQIATYYRADEARAFHVYVAGSDTFVFIHGGKRTIWLGYRHTTKKLLLHANELTAEELAHLEIKSSASRE
jgi:hypothetical protein